RDLDERRALPALDVDRPAVEDLLVPVEMPDEGLEATFEVERALAIGALVDERDPHALREVRGLTQALGDRLERVLDSLEHLGIGAELRPRPVPIALRRNLLDRPQRLAAPVFLGVDAAVARRLDAQPLGQRVHDADADAVQPAGNLVAATAELAARVEHRMDDLQR